MEAQPCPGCRERDARMAVLEARILELEGIVRDLVDKSKPPAPPALAPQLPPGPAKKATGRKPGGQSGHSPHLKQRLPPERIKELVSFVPTHCSQCQTRLPAEPGPHDPPPTWHQVAELPKLAADITEYQGHYRTCPCCGEINHVPIPADIAAHGVGPRLSATLSYLAGCHGVSKRGVEEIAGAVFEAPLALGTIANLEQELSAALATAHQEVLAAIAVAPVKHVDETGWKQAGRKRWLWVAATGKLVGFLIHPLRNLTALKRLLGDQWIGILCSDRWRVYDEWPLLQRQVCWAHLKRNWEKHAERGGTAQRLAEACLSVHRRVFQLWHLYRGGGTFAALDEGIAPLILELQDILATGCRSRDRKLARSCHRILDVYPALWTFAAIAGVEPTNNHAERVQRRAVLWRRRSFGCHSAAGCRFVERILTAVQTLRLQERSVLTFLEETLHAHRTGSQTPRLNLEG
jgi:transposase